MKITKSEFFSFARQLFFAGVILFFIGCNKEEIKVYSVPKERPASTEMGSANPQVSTEENSHPIHWTTPVGWKELAPTSMRIGNFLVSKGDGKAEVSILSFPGQVGTELDNVNRWRGEIGLPAIDEKEIVSQTVPIGEAQGKFYELKGQKSETLAAILEKEGASWFFKMRGDTAVVSDSKETFFQFLKSIRFHSDKPVVAAKIESTNSKPSKEPAAANEPKWEIPAGWKEVTASAMVLKSFSVSADKQEAKISISAFPGDVGGPLANANRWRAQLSLPPIRADELSSLLTSIDVLGGKASLVDMKGTDAKTGNSARMIAALVSRGDKTWFYKMVGEENLVGKEKEAFTKIVQTARYPND